MATRFEIYQLPLGEWTMVRVPKDYRNGDLLPHPKPSDPRFDSQAEAAAAMDQQMRRATRRVRPGIRTMVD